MSGKYTEELHRAPDDVLSFHEAVNTVGLLRLNFWLIYLNIVPVYENQVHPRSAHRKGSMACSDHSRISMEIQCYAETGSLNTSQLVRNLANIMSSVQEEVELAFEDELALDGHGAFLPIS